MYWLNFVYAYNFRSDNFLKAVEWVLVESKKMDSSSIALKELDDGSKGLDIMFMSCCTMMIRCWFRSHWFMA